MAWLNLDDKMRRHPKVAPLSDRAHRLLINLIGHCSEFLTDGVVDNSSLRREMRSILAQDRHVRELISAGLLHKNGDGYQIHDWDDWNRSAAEIKGKRAADAERQRRFRERRNA